MPTIKRAVSLDPALDRQADSAAKRMRISRSRLHTLALEDFLLRRDSDEITDRLNEVYTGGLNGEDKEFLDAAARHFAEITEEYEC